MALKATIGGANETGNLSFNEIIGYVPGQGRGDAKKGMYKHVRTGNILVVYSVNPQFVEIETRKNGKKTNRTGFTRTGMLVVEKATGKLRLVTADRNPDGRKDWVEYTGSVTFAGNPHVVPDAPAAASDEYDDED